MREIPSSLRPHVSRSVIPSVIGRAGFGQEKGKLGNWIKIICWREEAIRYIQTVGHSLRQRVIKTVNVMEDKKF